MTIFKTERNKDDGTSHDTCPTCGARAHTKATTDARGHSYRIECTACPWTLPIERPQTATHDAELIADGGTTADSTSDGGPQSAQDILDELYHDDSVARIADQIRTGGVHPSPNDALRTLALAKDRICFVFEHDCGVEYVWLEDGWTRFEARLKRDRDGATIDSVLEPGDLEHRLDRLVDVALVGSTPVSRPTGGDSQ